MKKPLVFVKYSKGGQGAYLSLDDLLEGNTTIKDIIKTLEALREYCDELTEINQELAQANIQLKNQVANLMKIKTIKYLNCKLDEQGYVVGVEPIEVVVEGNDLPADLSEGVYRIEGGHLVLDKNKKSAVHSII